VKNSSGFVYIYCASQAVDGLTQTQTMAMVQTLGAVIPGGMAAPLTSAG